jgi:hypothetical protein
MKNVQYSKDWKNLGIDTPTLQTLRRLAAREGQTLVGEIRVMMADREKFLDKREMIETEIMHRQQHNRKILAAEAKV